MDYVAYYMHKLYKFCNFVVHLSSIKISKNTFLMNQYLQRKHGAHSKVNMKHSHKPRRMDRCNQNSLFFPQALTYQWEMDSHYISINTLLVHIFTHVSHVLQPEVCNDFKFNFILLTCCQFRKKVNISNFFYLP